MPEILPDSVPSPRTPLVWDGARYRAVRGHTNGTLQVRGENQLFSIESRFLYTHLYVMPAAGGYLFYGNVVPPGEYWIITAMSAHNETGVSGVLGLGLVDAGARRDFRRRPDVPVNTSVDLPTTFVLDPGDYPFARFEGVGNGDRLHLSYNGYRITLET